MPEIPLLYGSTGFNNKVDPTNLVFDEKTGVVELSYAMNVDVELPFRVLSRKGYTQRIAGDWHSLYYPGSGQWFYCITGDALSRIDSSYNVTPLRNVTRNAWMNWTAIGDTVFYANGFEIGVIKNDGISYPWIRDSAIPQTPEYKGYNKDFVDPPIGKYLTNHNGRIYLSVGDIVYASEMLWYAYFNLDESALPFESSVNMLAAVSDGLYIGTEDGVYWCKGDHLQEMKAVKLPDEFGPVVPGTVCRCDGKLANDMYYGEGLIWVSKDQVCYAGPGGFYQDLSSHKLVLPDAVRGAAMMYKNQYYFVLHQI